MESLTIVTCYCFYAVPANIVTCFCASCYCNCCCCFCCFCCWWLLLLFLYYCCLLWLSLSLSLTQCFTTTILLILCPLFYNTLVLWLVHTRIGNFKISVRELAGREWSIFFFLFLSSEPNTVSLLLLACISHRTNLFAKLLK